MLAPFGEGPGFSEPGPGWSLIGLTQLRQCAENQPTLAHPQLRKFLLPFSRHVDPRYVVGLYIGAWRKIWLQTCHLRDRVIIDKPSAALCLRSAMARNAMSNYVTGTETGGENAD